MPAMPQLTIYEAPSKLWTLGPTFSATIDRSGVTVADYLRERGVTWQRENPAAAHVHLCKPGHGRLGLGGYLRGYIRHGLRTDRSCVVLLGEPREASPLEYRFARPENTLACAPGEDLARLYFGAEWIDPQLDGWPAREDRVCWIGRPTPSRVETARALERMNVPLDIYSLEPWPVSSWRGYAEDETGTSRRYRYRIVAENNASHGYHSEKLFNSIRSGCVTFYGSCPTLSLPHVKGAYLPLDPQAIAQRADHAPGVVEAMSRVMFTDAWTVYSFRAFYDRVIDMARKVADRR
jgi:hypothetical protein